MDTDTQSEIFNKHNTIVLPYFGKISKTILFVLKKFRIHTIFRILFGMVGLCLFNKSEFSIFRKLLEIFELFFLMKVHSKDYDAITKAIQ